VTIIVKGFTYTGNGSDDHEPSIGFPSGLTPHFVWIKRTVTTGDTVIATASAIAAGVNITPTTVLASSGGIKALIAGGVRLGTDASVNVSGGTYHGVAIYDDTATLLTTGSYTGNATDNRNISCTLDPIAVYVQRADSAASGRFRTSAHTGDSSQGLGTNATPTTNQIQAFGSGTFQIGTNNTVNSNGGTYCWFAFGALTNVCGLLDYTGNASDNRDLSVPGFTSATPAFALVKSEGIANGVFRMPSQAGDSTYQVGSGASITNAIQAFSTATVQVGTGTTVNSNGTIYHGFALAEAAITDATIAPKLHYYRQQRRRAYA